MYSLRPYQQSAIDATWSYLCNRPGHPVIVVPTGGGKSLLCAELAKGAIDNGLRVMVLAHRKELLDQNAEKIRTLLPDASIGIYSAGLKSKDTADDIIVAGIQSVYKRAFEFDARHLIIVDEAHLIPNAGDGMYRQFLADMKVSNPMHRVVGLTATPYRLDCGLICGRNELFDDFSYEVQIGELIKDGYLSPVINKPVSEVDTSALHHRGGEFIAAEAESLFEAHVVEACRETVEICNGDNRRHVLIFCAGVQHAIHVSEIIGEIIGEVVGVVTGDTLPLIRAALLEDFKNGKLRWLINVDVLTTGFDAPCIDCLAIMRATESPSLLAQMLGRGFRLNPGKENFLALDFGGNLRRLGQIDDPDFGKVRPKQQGGDMDAPQKQCPACMEFVPAGLRECSCGFLFPKPEPKHDPNADTESAVLMEQVKPQEWEVIEVVASVHVKKGTETKPQTRSLRMDYICRPMDTEEEDGNLSLTTISEWVCIEHSGFASRKAMEWWEKRSEIACPMDVHEALQIQQGMGLADTLSITTKKDGKFYRIVGAVLGEKPDSWEAADVDSWEDEEIPF